MVVNVFVSAHAPLHTPCIVGADACCPTAACSLAIAYLNASVSSPVSAVSISELGPWPARACHVILFLPTRRQQDPRAMALSECGARRSRLAGLRLCTPTRRPSLLIAVGQRDQLLLALRAAIGGARAQFDLLRQRVDSRHSASTLLLCMRVALFC